jgi:hypothetical protein
MYFYMHRLSLEYSLAGLCLLGFIECILIGEHTFSMIYIPISTLLIVFFVRGKHTSSTYSAKTVNSGPNSAFKRYI